MNKTDRKRIRQVINEAIESKLSLIDAHYCGRSKRRKNGEYYRIIPKEYRGIVAQWRRDIKAWERIKMNVGD